LLAIFVYISWSNFVFQCNQIGKKCILSTHQTVSHEACHRKLWYLHQKLGNFILFKLYMEPSVFNVALKREKRKYGATSTVAPQRLPLNGCPSTVAPQRLPWQQASNVLLHLPWEISMQQSNCKSCPTYWHLLLQWKNVSHLTFETPLLFCLHFTISLW
jgi:hypothetical protein